MPSTVVPVHSAMLSGAAADHVLLSSVSPPGSVTAHDRQVSTGSLQGQGKLTVTHQQYHDGNGPGHVIAMFGGTTGNDSIVGGSGNATVVGGGGNAII